MRYSLLFLLAVVLVMGCRPAQYIRTGHLDRSVFQLSAKRVLVLDLQSNISHSKEEDYTSSLLAYLKTCPDADIIGMTTFYNRFNFGFAAAATTEEQLNQLARFTNLDFLLVPYARIQENSLLPLLPRDWEGKNQAIAGIEIFDVQTGDLIKRVEYQGQVSQEIQVNEDDEYELPLELTPSGQRIVKNCYERSLRSFLRYAFCEKAPILQ